jgi:hypothetical protein
MKNPGLRPTEQIDNAVQSLSLTEFKMKTTWLKISAGLGLLAASAAALAANADCCGSIACCIDMLACCLK